MLQGCSHVSLHVCVCLVMLSDALEVRQTPLSAMGFVWEWGVEQAASLSSPPSGWQWFRSRLSSVVVESKPTKFEFGRVVQQNET